MVCEVMGWEWAFAFMPYGTSTPAFHLNIVLIIESRQEMGRV